jgi:hypothetical protein
MYKFFLKAWSKICERRKKKSCPMDTCLLGWVSQREINILETPKSM